MLLIRHFPQEPGRIWDVEPARLEPVSGWGYQVRPGRLAWGGGGVKVCRGMKLFACGPISYRSEIHVAKFGTTRGQAVGI